jgi:DNA-binding MarR family transcriptional regulator
LAGTNNDSTGSPELPGEKSRQNLPFEQLKRLLLRKRLRRPLRLTEDHILSLVFARRARGAVFGGGLFSDPAWDILLELYAARLGGRRMSLQDLALAIETPASTTRRWVSVLEHRALIRTLVQTDEPSCIWISLTDEGASRMEHLSNHWASAFVSI